MYIFKAAVVGAGTMGGEIAQVITYSGLPVVMKDIANRIRRVLDEDIEQPGPSYKSG